MKDQFFRVLVGSSVARKNDHIPEPSTAISKDGRTKLPPWNLPALHSPGSLQGALCDPL
jgi:hypothetical protein